MTIPSFAQVFFLSATLLCIVAVLLKFACRKPRAAGDEPYYKARKKGGWNGFKYTILLFVVIFFQKDGPYWWITLLLFLFLVLTILANLKLSPDEFLYRNTAWEDGSPKEQAAYYAVGKYEPVHNYLWTKVHPLRIAIRKRPRIVIRKKSRAKLKEISRVRFFRRLVVAAVLVLVAIPWAVMLIVQVSTLIGHATTSENSAAPSVGSETSVTQPAPAPAPTSSATPSAATTTSSAAPAAEGCNVPALIGKNQTANFTPDATLQYCGDDGSWYAWVKGDNPSQVTLKGETGRDSDTVKANGGYIYAKVEFDDATHYIRWKAKSSS